MPRQYFFQLTWSLLDVKKKVFLKTNKSDSNFQMWTETPCKKTSSYWRFIGVTHWRKSSRGRGRAVIIILLKLFLNSWSCPPAHRGAGRRKKSPLDGATDFLWKIWQHITTVSFASAFIFFVPESQKTPLDMSKWGLKIVLFISNMHAGFFWYRAGLVITRWMLEKDIIVTPTLQRGLTRQGSPCW